jgi:hypothetical protein
MQDFELPQRTARLIFEGDFEGAEVIILLDASIGQVLKAQKLLAEGNIEALCQFLALILVDWNVADHDGRLPADFEGLLRCTPAFVGALVDQWVKAQTEPPLPLGASSRNGSTSTSPEPSPTS